MWDEEDQEVAMYWHQVEQAHHRMGRDSKAPCKHTAAHMVAETWNYWQHMPKDEARALCRKLWGFQNDAKNPTPTGGDGSDGTVEDPRDTLDPANDDKMPHWWDKLTDAERRALTLAHKQQ